MGSKRGLQLEITNKAVTSGVTGSNCIIKIFLFKSEWSIMPSCQIETMHLFESEKLSMNVACELLLCTRIFC